MFVWDRNGPLVRGLTVSPFGCEAFHLSSAGGEVHSSFECHHKRRCLDMQDCLENLVQERILHLQNQPKTPDIRQGIEYNGMDLELDVVSS